MTNQIITLFKSLAVSLLVGSYLILILMHTSVGVFLLHIAFITVMVAGHVSGKRAQYRMRILQNAQLEYKMALDVLQQTKSDNARIDALNKGRYYASLSREEDSRVTIFDELALKNDLDAYGL